VIVKPEKRRAAQSLSLIAAVLQVCNIAQINWQRLALLNHSGGIQADRRQAFASRRFSGLPTA
jgi:hypothetical protein